MLLRMLSSWRLNHRLQDIWKSLQQPAIWWLQAKGLDGQGQLLITLGHASMKQEDIGELGKKTVLQSMHFASLHVLHVKITVWWILKLVIPRQDVHSNPNSSSEQPMPSYIFPICWVETKGALWNLSGCWKLWQIVADGCFDSGVRLRKWIVIPNL